MRSINMIVLHCSATREGKDFKAKDIKRWHMSPPNNWKDIGYHYVIDLDGTIEGGRNEAKVGAHAYGYNAHSIGICYVGGLAADGKTAKDTRTNEQKISLYKLVHALLAKYKLGINNVRCHNELTKKACPSFKIADFRKEYKAYYD